MALFETDSLGEYIVLEYRWVLVLFALLPVSFVWKVWSVIRNYVVFKMSSAPKKHEEKVKEVQRQVKEWLGGDRKTHMCTARPTWQTMSIRQSTYKKYFTRIKINLVDILEIDTKNMTVRCEPMVSMGQLSRTLQPMGLSLPMVPEMDELTVGGMCNGTGVESSSHVFGLFQFFCLQFELVLADGSVVTCSKDENPDLFYTVPWSHGTLGFVVSATLKIIPAKKYVRLQYEPFTKQSDFLEYFNKVSTAEKPPHFIEALMFNKDTGVIMTGDLVDAVGSDGQYNPIGRWYAKWFYSQVEEHLASNKRVIEYIPLRDYYHRHSKGLFWEMREIVPFGNSFWFRFLLGWLMPPEVSLLKLTQTDGVRRMYDRVHVLQDLLIPIEVLKKTIDLADTECQVYPLWVCPFKVFNNPGLLNARTTADYRIFVDVGIYGICKAKGFETIPSSRRLEKFVLDNKGFQMLGGDTYMTREEFRQMFDHTLYDKVRNSLPHCKEAFPEIYDKVKKSVKQ